MNSCISVKLEYKGHGYRGRDKRDTDIKGHGYKGQSIIVNNFPSPIYENQCKFLSLGPYMSLISEFYCITSVINLSFFLHWLLELSDNGVKVLIN